MPNKQLPNKNKSNDTQKPPLNRSDSNITPSKTSGGKKTPPSNNSKSEYTCFACNKETSGETVTFQNHSFHPNCLECFTFKKNIVGNKCLSINDLPYCSLCGKKAFISSQNQNRDTREKKALPTPSSKNTGSSTVSPSSDVPKNNSAGGNRSANMPSLLGKDLLRWVQRQLEPYNITVTNFSGSFRDGIVFCALLHSINPSCIVHPSKLTPSQRQKNLSLAFSTAEKLGITKLLDEEDFEICPPEPKSVSLYTSLIYNYSKKK